MGEVQTDLWGKKIKPKPDLKDAWGFAGLVTPAIIIFLGWFFLAGMVGWDGQIQMLVIIGIGLWLLLR